MIETPSRILVVDDEPSITEFVSYALKKEGYETDVVDNGEDAFALASANNYDLFILDIMLPGMDGLSLCETIRRGDSDIGIIIVSAKGQESDKIRGLSIGADDYITKPFNILELKARIKAILRRSVKKTPAETQEKKVLKARDLELSFDSRRVFISGKEVNLTAKEFDLLELLVTNPNKVYSRESLLEYVWGNKAMVSGDVRTVDVHVRRLREKIEPSPSDPKYVHTKWGVGYFFRA